METQQTLPTIKRTRHEVAVMGGQARMAKLRESGELRSHQRAAAGAFMAKYGKAALIEKVAAWRRVNPSKPEIAARAILERLDLVDDADFHREFTPFPGDNEHAFILDFVLGDPSTRHAIEIDGAMHDNVGFFADDARANYYRERERVLLDAGWKITHVRADDLRSDYGVSQIADAVNAAARATLDDYSARAAAYTAERVAAGDLPF